MSIVLPETTWHAHAACLDVGPSLFEPDDYSPRHQAQVRAAKEVCDACPVRQLCLAEAIAEDDQHTIRGGLTPKQRAKIGRRPKRPLQPCGTSAAYARHRSKGEVPCEACMDANAAKSRAAVARKRGAA